MTERFVISTGRSGSTLFSRMLAQNRRLLVLSEFIAGVDFADRLRPGVVTGSELRRILSADDDISALIGRRGRRSSEILYEGRGHAETSTGRAPSLVRVTLPAFTDDPEGLFEAMCTFAERQPPRSIGDQYRAVFEHLCEQLGRDAWVERSGMSVRVMAGLRAAFPNARYLHLHRDGLETALSMRAHPWFRVGVFFDSQPPSLEQARALLDRAAADDLIETLHRNPPPPELYGRHWTQVMARAYREFASLPADSYAELRYEHVLSDTRAALAAAAEFLHLPHDDGWIERAVALVDAEAKPRVTQLSPEELTRLLAACLPGQILTGRSDPGGLDEAQAAIRQAFLELRKEATP